MTRESFTDKSTCGTLYIDGQQECFTLELPNKDGKPGSCIPQGTYPVTAQWSPRFGRTMPHLQDIPGRSNILMHWGNTDIDTEGCILLGQTRGSDFVGHSRDAFDAFWPKFMQALATGTVSIQVLGGAALAGNHDEVRNAATGEA